jgi:hypothetical protein
MPTRSLADALADSPAGPLLERVARVRRISQALAPAAAQLAPDFDVHDPWACELREDVLLLNARSSAQAAKLRQGIPGLLRLLHQQGAQVNEIRVKVQPARMIYPERASQPPQVSLGAQEAVSGDLAKSAPPMTTTAVAGLKKLAQTLARDLHDSPLRQAAERLQESLRDTEDPNKGPTDSG